ncbi:MAG: SDR family NAD(P)-dependent oxidoreductase [bacterium]
MLRRALDKAMDLTVVPGFTRIGYSVRSRGWSDPTAGKPLGGKAVLITGPTAGLGTATAKGLARAGADLHLAVRNLAKGESLDEEIRAEIPDAKVTVWECDVSDLDSIRGFAGIFCDTVDRLDVLIHNAGILAAERRRSAQGFELTFATNALGPFLLTELLLEPLERGAPSRVIFVSSGGMYAEALDVEDLQLEGREFRGDRFYAHTKRIEVILAELISERYGARGITGHSSHPGWAYTAGMAEALPRFHKLTGPILRTADQGADTVVWMSHAPEVLANPGEFWHDREPRPKHRLPATRETAMEREELWRQLSELAGVRSD